MRVVICAFNEARLLPMALASIPQGIPITVIDGAYSNYPHTNPASTDGTLDIAETYGADVVRVKTAWPDQTDKRTLSLTLDPIVFVVDADEIVRGWEELPEDADVGWVRIESPLYAEPYWEPRIFRVRDGWHYAGRHHWIYDADGKLVTSHRREGEGYSHVRLSVTVTNHRDWRDPGRHREKVRYAEKRNAKEGAYRNESAPHAGA